jgi:chromosomal replication initiator protein
LIVDIQPLDLETRVAILKKKGELDGVHVPDDVILFIATKIKYNIRELEGAFVRVNALASLLGCEINLELAQRAIKDIVPHMGDKQITIDSIQRKVAGYFDLRLSDMKIKKRDRAFAFPRHIAMYLCRELTDTSLQEIGENFGGRDHTTIIHGYNKIKEQLVKDRNLENILNQLMESIKE